MKLDLKDVTLVCADCADPLRTVKAFENTLNLCSFPYVKLFTNVRSYPLKEVELVYTELPSETREIGLESYSKFCIGELAACVDTPYCLIIQHDGYVVNSRAWTDDFLQYDYIGAPWEINSIGNGGFSLRSKKLLVAGTKLKVSQYNPEDVTICVTKWSHFESAGCRKAPYELAYKFSAENVAYNGSFGFHGETTRQTLDERLYNLDSALYTF